MNTKALSGWSLRAAWMAVLLLALPVSGASAIIYTKSNTDKELSTAFHCLGYFLSRDRNFDHVDGLISVQDHLERLVGERNPKHIAEMIVLYARHIREMQETSDLTKLVCHRQYLKHQ